MTLQVSVAVSNARLDAMEQAIGTTPTFKLFTGSAPASTATADSGTVLASFALPSDWMGTASNRSKALAGTWSGSASATGTAGYFRIYDSGGVCHMQGSVGTTGTDMIVSSTSITSGQTFSVTAYTLNDPNG